jgi:hypothetical protein
MLNSSYDPEDLNSFVQDVYDVNQFKRAYARVLRPAGEGKKGIRKVPVEPYFYQDAWTNDERPLKAIFKSRQIGFSYNEMLDSLHSAITIPNYQKFFFSVTQPQANELLTIAKHTIQAMQPEYQIPLVKKGESKLEFENGARLIALPSSEGSVRSYHGDIFIDEIAHIPNDKPLLDALMQVTVREGYNVSIGTTPYGQRGEFHRIIKESGWDTTTSWEDINLAKKFMERYSKFLREQDGEWSVHAVPWYMCKDLHWERIITRAKGDALRQEYGLAFLDETTALLPYQLMMDRVNFKLKQWDEFYKRPRREGVRIIFGIDPAEMVNQTALVVFEYHEKTGKYYKRYRQSWSHTDHVEFNPEIAHLFKLWKGDVMYIDVGGMGRPVYNDMRKNQGIANWRIVPIDLSNTKKKEVANNMLAVFEAGTYAGKNDDDTKYRIEIDHDTTFMDQLHQLRRESTKFGNTRFTGKIEGKDDDIIWGTALCLIENLEEEDGSFLIDDVSYKEDYRDSGYYG